MFDDLFDVFDRDRDRRRPSGDRRGGLAGLLDRLPGDRDDRDEFGRGVSRHRWDDDRFADDCDGIGQRRRHDGDDDRELVGAGPRSRRHADQHHDEFWDD